MTVQPTNSPLADENDLRSLYQQLMEGWNNRNADTMAETFAEDGEMIGFDGSHLSGRDEIATHLKQIFADHPTPPYVCKVKGVRLLSTESAILRAIAGMVPPGQTDLDSRLNAHHTVVAVKRAGIWRIELFQNTPAQFHGRPELVEKMTAELRGIRR